MTTVTKKARTKTALDTDAPREVGSSPRSNCARHWKWSKETKYSTDYVGLELSHVMVRITKEKLNGAGDVVQADAEDLPFKPSVFDDVVSVRSFHFLPHPEAFLSEADRVLKLTGRVTVSFEQSVRGREAFRKLMGLPSSNAKRTYHSNPQVALMMCGARFEALFSGNITKLPLLLYWRSKDDRILRGVHGKIPYLLGTVGMVVGSKESLGVD